MPEILKIPGFWDKSLQLASLREQEINREKAGAWNGYTNRAYIPKGDYSKGRILLFSLGGQNIRNRAAILGKDSPKFSVSK